MNLSGLSIRHKLYDYIRVADDKRLFAIYQLLENEIEQTELWWKNKAFTAELDRRFQALENETDRGYTIDQLEASIVKLRKKKYG